MGKRLAGLLLHNMCSATPSGKTAGISRGPGPVEVNSPVIVKGRLLKELRLQNSALVGWLGLFTESFFRPVSSDSVCFELIDVLRCSLTS